MAAAKALVNHNKRAGGRAAGRPRRLSGDGPRRQSLRGRDGLPPDRRRHSVRFRAEGHAAGAIQKPVRACLKSGGMPDRRRFFRWARRFGAGILCVFPVNPPPPPPRPRAAPSLFGGQAPACPGRGPPPASPRSRFWWCWRRCCTAFP